MAKRKRDDWNGSEVDIIVDKKAKLDHTKHKQTYRPAVSGKNVSRKTSAVAPTAGNGSHAKSSTQGAKLQPPPGLSKGARKRWRKRQKKLEESANSGDRSGTLPKQAQDVSQKLAPVPSTGPSREQSIKGRVKKSRLKGFAVTHLMPRRKQEWREEEPLPNASKVTQVLPTAEPESTDREKGTLASEDSSNEELNEVEISVPEEKPSGSHEEATSSSSSNSSSVSAERAAEDKIAPAPQSQLDGGAQSNYVRKEDNSRPTNTLLGGFSSTSLLSVPPMVSNRRSSFGNRATSVPSFSENRDIVNSFKRFSAFLHKDGSSSEEDDSDTDSQTSEDARRPSQQSQVERLNQEVAAAPEFTNAANDETYNTNSSHELAANDETEVDQLPRFSDSLLQPPSANGSSWPANVGIKRQLSFLGREPGGIPSRSGAGPECEAETQHSPAAAQQSDLSNINDDSQELLRTVDEITNTVFGSTRPLPASMPPQPPDPDVEGLENGVLTCVSSDRRMTRSMSTPKSSQPYESRTENVPNRNTIQTGGVEQDSMASNLADSSMRHGSEEVSESMSENIEVAIPGSERDDSDVEESSRSLSELSRSPSPPVNVATANPSLHDNDKPDSDTQHGDADPDLADTEASPALRKKRKMTGRTSKHFTPQKRAARIRSSATHEVPKTTPSSDEVNTARVGDAEVTVPTSTRAMPKEEPETPKRRTRASSKVDEHQEAKTEIEDPEKIDSSEVAVEAEAETPQTEEQPVSHSTRSATKKRKTTSKRSSYFAPPKPPLDLTLIDRVDLYNTSGKKRRVPAGTSTAPVPPITADRFGIIQEKLWREPFWLLIAVTLLNKTTGRAAVPVFWALKEKYASPEVLAKADQGELRDMIYHLGFHNQRSKRFIEMAKAWVERPPERGWRAKTDNYPAKGDHRRFRGVQEIDDDADDCAGALEIGHIPGTGAYAYDSWRIFCRDVLRGVAADYNGADADEGFIPEWQKVVPGDKELRACLRWMWLREGWIWNHETGDKRRATDEEMAKALQGEMEIEDPQERKFAAQAAGVEVSPFKAEEEKVDMTAAEDSRPEVKSAPKLEQNERMKTPESDSDDDSDNIVVTPVATPAKKATRRSRRLTS